MVTLLKEGIFQQAVDRMPMVSINEQSGRELERAMLLLSAIAHAYVKCQEKDYYLPPQVALPWTVVARKLGRHPVLSHASLVLQNWHRKDKQQSFELKNLQTAISFTGTPSESWFFLLTAQIEKVGAEAIPIFLESIQFAKQGQLRMASTTLEQAIPILRSLLETLQQMYAGCDPQVFFHQLRPFIDSFVEVKYKGVTPEIHSYAGGSAAQSSLLQFF